MLCIGISFVNNLHWNREMIRTFRARNHANKTWLRDSRRLRKPLNGPSHAFSFKERQIGNIGQQHLKAKDVLRWYFCNFMFLVLKWLVGHFEHLVLKCDLNEKASGCVAGCCDISKGFNNWDCFQSRSPPGKREHRKESYSMSHINAK